MAYSQQFSDHLLRQLSEANRRNLELQSLLAHKDDQMGNINSQLQRALNTPAINTQPSLVQNLQKRNTDFQGQLQHAKQATEEAQRKLNDRTRDFNAVYTQQQQQILALQQKLNLTSIDTKTVMPLEDSCKVVSLEKDLAKANSELQRLRTAYSSLQTQYEAEKKQSEQRQSVPATAPEKVTQTYNNDDDMDDDEPNTTWIKQETRNAPTAGTTPKPPSLTSKKSMPPPSIPGKPSHPSRKPATSSTTTLASRPKVVKPAKKPSTSAPSAPHPKPKERRRRSLAASLASDLSDLEPSSPPPRKRPHRSLSSTSIDVNPSDIRQKFPFQAITDYSPDGSMHYLLSSDAEDIIEPCELWDHVKAVVDAWEEAKGERMLGVRVEFEHKMREGGGEEVLCEQQVEGGGEADGARTSWRQGCEGKYACRTCVEENVPCFTWDGEGAGGGEGGFKLLPLHRQDRDERWPLKEGFELRYWVNGE